MTTQAEKIFDSAVANSEDYQMSSLHDLACECDFSRVEPSEEPDLDQYLLESCTGREYTLFGPRMDFDEDADEAEMLNSVIMMARIDDDSEVWLNVVGM